LAVAFAGIGLLTAWAGWLSARGSKFWQENWEKHIDLLEDEIEGSLHKTIWIGPRGIQFSVSRVNERLNFILFIFWLLLLAAVFCIVLQVPIWNTPWWLILVLGSLVIVAATAWLWHTESQLTGRLYEEDTDDWQAFPPEKHKKFRILRRDAP
jgi:hypothetical protein